MGVARNEAGHTPWKVWPAETSKGVQVQDTFTARRAAAQASAGSAGALAYRARAKRLTRADQVRNSVNVIRHFWMRDFGFGFGRSRRPFPHALIQQDVEQHFMLRPPHAVGRHDVAIHEAGHFLMAHVEGFTPAVAKIYGRGNAWGGEIWLWDTPCPADPRADPHELWSYACVTVAGPIAVELLGDIGKGGATDCIEELFDALFILERAAELRECDPLRLWRQTLYETAQRVEMLTAEILDLAEILSRRKTIWASDPAVQRILRRVDARSHEFLAPLSARCQEILASIHNQGAQSNEVCKWRLNK
jgi:hypothetical protein